MATAVRNPYDVMPVSDLQKLMSLKKTAQTGFEKTGAWDPALRTEATDLRTKYGILEDSMNLLQTSGYLQERLAAEKASPFSDSANDTLKMISDYIMNPKPYDVTTDPSYGPLKEQYEKAGMTAFNNTIGRLSTLTGGRPSTAAVGTAHAGMNEYMQEFSGKVLPSLVEQAYGRQQDQIGNLGKLYGLQTGTEETAYNRSLTERGYADTQAATERDTTNQNYDNAMDLWRTMGTANEYVSKTLGVPVGAKTADYNLATTKIAMAGSGGGSGGSGGTVKSPSIIGGDLTKLGTPEQIKNYKAIKDRLMEKYKTSPSEALRFILSQDDATSGIYSKMMGDLLYQRMLNDFGTTTPGKYSYKSDPNFMEDRMLAQSGGEAQYNEIVANWKEFYNAYGYDGLKELMQIANPKMAGGALEALIQDYINNKPESTE